jgi:hypothetical protein
MQTTTNHQEPTREEFRRLPITERRKVLRRQARQVAVCYEENPETIGIGGGDFVAGASGDAAC